MNASEPPTIRFRLLMLVLLAAFVVRGAVLYQRFDHLDLDPDAYRILAENLANYEGFGHVDDDGCIRPTAYRPPGYPFILATLVTGKRLPSLSVAILHLVLGVGTVWLVFVIGVQVNSNFVGTLAAMLVAIDPLLLNQSTLVMTETVAVFVVAIVWWLVIRRYGMSNNDDSTRVHFVFGVTIGLALAVGYFVRPVFVVWAFFIVLVILASGWQRRNGSVLAVIGLCVVMGLAVGMWMWRNMMALGKPVWATTHGGYTLLLGNNPPFYDYLQSMQFGEKWEADFFHHRWAERRFGDPTTKEFWVVGDIGRAGTGVDRSEIQDDQLAQKSAMATIHREPSVFVYSCFVRVGRLWSPMPHTGDLPWPLRWGIGAFYCSVFALTALGCWQLRRRLLEPPWLIAIFLAFGLSGVHAFYWSNMRMRSMATPMLAVASAVGCQRLLSKADLHRL